MRELHVVALSEDGRSVLLATTADAARGGFRVALDGRLSAAVRGELPRPGEEEVRESGLSVKDIQARLRAGQTVEQIADEAGVPVARVERYAGPVESERARVVDQAQAAFVSRRRHGTSALPLGDAVALHLDATPSLRPESVDWTARREDAGSWVVALTYVSRARQRTCAWRYDPTTRAVTALDGASGAMAHVDAADVPVRLGRRAAVPAPAAVAAPRRTTKRSAPAARPATKPVAKKPVAKQAVAKKPVAKQAVAKKPVARKPVAKQAVAKKPVARKPVARKPVAKKATTVAKKPVAKPVAKPAAEQAAPKPAAPKPAVRKVASPRKAAPRPAPPREAPAAAARVRLPQRPRVAAVQTPDGPPALRVVPDPPARPRTRRTDDVRRQGGRATVPVWADVLLGTAPRDDRGGEG